MSDLVLDLPIFEPTCGHPQEVWRRSDHHQLQETHPDLQPQPVAHPLCWQVLDSL